MPSIPFPYIMLAASEMLEKKWMKEEG